MEVEAFMLECGCGYSPNTGFGICTGCNSTCCKSCLERIDGMLLCPECFKSFVLER